MISPRSFYESVVTSPVDFLRVGDFGGLGDAGGDWCLGNADFAIVLSKKEKNKNKALLIMLLFKSPKQLVSLFLSWSWHVFCRALFGRNFTLHSVRIFGSKKTLCAGK